jgi:hypothetical protein
MAGSLAGCDFIQPVEGDPNAVPVATLDQLLVAVTVNAYVMDEGQSSRAAAVWMQQMNGTDRQFISLAEYVLTEEDGADVQELLYPGAGLVDIRNGIRLATADDRIVYRGIFKVYEAWAMGMAAAEYGDLAYSEAVDPEIGQPVLDTQESIYDAVIALLDDAVTDLNSGTGSGPGVADFAYGGNATQWVAAARTLQARFQMHLAERRGAAAYGAAITAAGSGIQSAAGDYLADHSTAAAETFFWRQFMRDRSSYIVAGQFLTNLMNERADDRMLYYYSQGAEGSLWADTVIGSYPGEDGTGDPWNNSSELACGPNNTRGCQGYGAGSAEFDFAMISCAENYFILAEAQYQTAVPAATVEASLDNAIQCSEDLWNDRYGIAVDLSNLISRNNGMTGATLFAEIMEQKYSHMFLHRETWSDYKRTCEPGITPFGGLSIPRRFLYSNNERESNENVPPPSDQPVANWNDPNPCP